MSAAQQDEWRTPDQRRLMLALAEVRQALAGTSPVVAPAEAATPPADVPRARLDLLQDRLGLSPFECRVLLLCAGMELDPAFAESCAARDPRRPYPSAALALSVWPDLGHWDAFTPARPLRAAHLIEIARGGQLRIDEWVLDYLTGVSYLDERLQPLLQPLTAGPAAELPASQRLLLTEMAARWSGPAPQPILQICGEDAGEQRVLAAAACAALGLHLHVLRAAEIPVAAPDRHLLLLLWERQALLCEGALLIEVDETESTEVQQRGLLLAERLRSPAAIACRTPLRPRGRPLINLYLSKPSATEQRRLWSEALGPLAGANLDAVVSQFNLGPRSICSISAEIKSQMRQSPDPQAEAPAPGRAEALWWQTCRTQNRARMEDLAQRIEPAASWSDLVLPELPLQLLRDIATQVRHRAQVYETWGFGARSERGLGISALFCGLSGTGKTMAAEVLAGELQLDLYRIDLSSVVSKYIGETEKNLRRVFDAAEEGGAILLFDEADALFGKRSDVKDSHDRYANIEVSYLLQRMEAYRGLAILTTNMKEALDAAFLRRLRFVIEFPFPDARQRAEIWRRIFPRDTPTAELEPIKLARLDVAGGNIRNVALNAAFLAAEDGGVVRMRHILRAARGEYAKLEKPLTEAEIGGWIDAQKTGRAAH